jgi:branched-chain amino acid transport system substrate-binding protein
MPLTGPGSAYGKFQANGSQVVADAINKAGGIRELGGAKIKLLVVDTKSDPKEAARVVREMKGEGASAIIGPLLSSEALAVKPLLQSLQIPAFASAADARITEDNEDGWIFRQQASVAITAQETVDFIAASVKDGTLPPVKTVGIVATSTPPGSSISPILEKGLSGMGIKTVLLDYDPAQVKDFAPTVARLKQEEVDLVAGYQLPNDGALFAQAIAGQSWRPPAGFIFTNSPMFSDAYRQTNGQTVAGWVTSAFTPSLDSDYFPQATRDLAEQFKADNGVSMEGSTGSVGASGMAVVADAIAAAKSSDPKKIAAAARKLKFGSPKDSAYPYWMTSGGVAFDKNQDNVGAIIPFIQVTSDGGFETVYPAKIADGELKPVA